MALPVVAAGLLSVIFGAIVKAFLFLIGFAVVRFLLLIGFSYITYQGFDALIHRFLNHVINQFVNLPEFVTSTIALAKFDVFISIIFSAYAIKYTIQTASKISFFK